MIGAIVDRTRGARFDFVPPSAKTCGAMKSRAEDLEVDVPDDANPFVTFVRHLESKGLTRTEQDVSRPDFQSASFESVVTPTEKGVTAYLLHMMLKRVDGRWDATLTLNAECRKPGIRQQGECKP